MGEFYKLLTEYNKRMLQVEQRPLWHHIYQMPSMPVYLKVLLRRLELLDKNFSIIEVGSGYGDVLAMLIHLGFKNAIGVEKDISACKSANKKLQSLFHTNKEYVICKDYPIKLNYCPDIYIQVNNVYIDSLASKEEYIKRSLEWVRYNGRPKYSFIEYIDSSYTGESKHYPHFVRLSVDEVKKMFSGQDVKPFTTYEYPKNTSSKCLYEIKETFNNHSHSISWNAI